jgi:hypothetical protein
MTTPVDVIAITAMFTSIFAVYMPHSVGGVPAYARISLIVVATSNILRALRHWLALPDGDLSAFNLGPPSVPRALAIGFRRKTGQEVFWLNMLSLYISYKAPQLTFTVLKLQLCRVVFNEITIVLYAPFTFKGVFLLKETAEEYGRVDLVMVTVPLLYALLFSDTVYE